MALPPIAADAPVGLAADRSGRLYVALRGPRTVAVFDSALQQVGLVTGATPDDPFGDVAGTP